MNIKNSKLEKLLTKPITIGPNSTLVKVREALLKNKVKRLVVIDKKNPMAVITEKDIAKKNLRVRYQTNKISQGKKFQTKKIIHAHQREFC